MAINHFRGTLVPVGETQRCKSPAGPPARVFTINTGPHCTECNGTEAACARLAGCCPDCTHWADFTVDGEEITRPVGRPRRPRRRAS